MNPTLIYIEELIILCLFIVNILELKNSTLNVQKYHKLIHVFPSVM